MQLEAASDFELEESDTGSEVFAIDEEDVDQNAATAMAPSAFAEDEDEEDDGFEQAVSSEMATAWTSTTTARTAAAAGAGHRASSRGRHAEWGGLWVGLLGVATLLHALRLASSRSTWSGTSTTSRKPLASGLVRAIAGIFGG